MKKVVTIAGSNSQKSINKLLIEYTTRLIGNAQFLNIDLNNYALPIYGEDYEAVNGIPEAVKILDEIIDSADGFVISLAEHNGSYTAVFKNTLDWLSRLDTKIWKEKPMLLMATSPGARGATTILRSARDSFPFLGAKIIETYSLPSFYENFKEGEIIGADFRVELEAKTTLFSAVL